MNTNETFANVNRSLLITVLSKNIKNITEENIKFTNNTTLEIKLNNNQIIRLRGYKTDIELELYILDGDDKIKKDKRLIIDLNTFSVIENTLEL